MRIGLCLCGCGASVPLLNKRGNLRKGYVHGHNGRSSPLAVLVDDETGCWVWQWSRTRQGYGRVRVGRRVVLAHRLFYERLVEPLPKGVPLDHLCRNPSCVNPAHLERVSVQVNNRRGRLAKLDEERVRDIRRRGLTASEVQSEFGLSYAAAWDVVAGRSWADVVV